MNTTMNTSCYCPVTHRHFTAIVRQFDNVGSMTFGWFRCPFCDRFGRTNSEPGYNARYAQWHRQQLDVKSATSADTGAAPLRLHHTEQLSLILDKRVCK